MGSMTSFGTISNNNRWKSSSSPQHAASSSAAPQCKANKAKNNNNNNNNNTMKNYDRPIRSVQRKSSIADVMALCNVVSTPMA